MEQQKILIVDDDDRNIFALRAVLQSRGYTCETAVSGQQALDRLQAGVDIGTALVDMMMPGMDGYELIHRIRQIPSLSQVRLVAVTAQAMMGDRERCLAGGADAYVSKPVNVDILLQALAETIKPR